MDAGKSMFEPNKRRKIEESHTISNFLSRRSRNNLYPSSFYSKGTNDGEEELIDTPSEKRKKTTGGPLILPPPPTVSMERKKVPEQQEQPVKKKREEEIISLPEDHDDEIMYKKEEEKKGAPVSPIEKELEYDDAPVEGEIWEEDKVSDAEYSYQTVDQDEEYWQEKLEYADEEWVEEQDLSEEPHCKEGCSLPKDKNEPKEKYPQYEVKIVRLPVLLLKEELTLDIFDSFNVLLPLTDLSKIDWTVKSFKASALPPSNKVFIELVLSADIEFVSGKSGNLRSLKIYVPLQKVVSVSWLVPPELPSTSSKEFFFKERDGLSVSTHREWEEKLVRPVEFQLNSFNVIWHNELYNGKQGKSQLGIQGTAQLSLEATQEQTVAVEM